MAEPSKLFATENPLKQNENFYLIHFFMLTIALSNDFISTINE